MTDAMKRRLFAVAAVAVAIGALTWISMSNLGDDLVYYLSPTELAQKPEARDATVRLGGMVVAGTYTWDQATHVVEFDMTDTKTTVHVRNEGNPPQMFREGIGVVVEGRLGADGVFHSDKVMVSHDNEYKPPGEGEDPEDVYKNIAKTIEET